MFDPLNKNFRINYLIIIIILLINYNYWSIKNLYLVKIIKFNINKNNNSNFIYYNLIFFTILIINLINIIPIIYSISHNIIFILNLTIILWLITINFAIINNFNIIFLNLSPNKTSLILILIINLIEFNRLIFSILSISIRLIINIIIGHLIFYILSIKILIYIYIIIEIFIIIIQSYIFITLNIINFNNIK